MKTMTHLYYEIGDDQTGTLFFPQPFDPLQPELQTALRTALSELAQKKLVGLVIRSTDSLYFGSDTSAEEVLHFPSRQAAQAYAHTWQALAEQLHALPYTVVCALSGRCVGVALELALACDWRIGTPATQLGIFDIQVGSLPKAGTLHRLPRLVGLQTALDLLLTGRMISGIKAYQTGLLHACVPAPLMESQCRVLLQRVSKHKRLSAAIARTSAFSRSLPKWAMEGNPIGRKMIFKKTRETIEEKTQGRQPAAYHCLDAVAYGFETTGAKALQKEAELFAASISTREAQSLSHLHRIRMQVQASAVISPPSSPTIGLLGASRQKGDLALCAVTHGHRVRLYEENTEAIGGLLRQVYEALLRKVDKREIALHKIPQYMAQLSPCRSQTGLSQCEWVLDLTQSPAKLHMGTTTVLAYFLPSPSDFVEICCPKGGDITSIKDRLHGIGKTTLTLYPEGPFFLPHMETLFFSEALHLAEKGLATAAIDKALEEFGFRVGPFRWMAQRGETSIPTATSALEWEGADIVNRFLLVLLHATCAHLEQYPHASLESIEILLVEGLGFPDIWGGLLKYADFVGIRSLRDNLVHLAEQEGPRFLPSAWLEKQGRFFPLEPVFY